MTSPDNNAITVETVVSKFDSVIVSLSVTKSGNRIFTRSHGLNNVINLLKDINQSFDEYLIIEETEKIMSHDIFSYIRDTMISIIEMLNQESVENMELETEFYNEGSYFLLEIINNVQRISTFENVYVQNSFIQSVISCLNSFSIDGNHVGDYNIVFGIKCLLEAFGMFRAKSKNHDHPLLLLLLDTTLNCLYSNYYLETFKNLDSNATLFFKEQELFLDTCPKYVYNYRGEHQNSKITKISRNILNYAQHLFNKFTPSAFKWHKFVLLQSFINLINLMNIIPAGDFLEFLSTLDWLVSIFKPINFILDDVNSKRRLQKIELLTLILKLIYRIVQHASVHRYIKSINDAIAIFENLSSSKIANGHEIKDFANMIHKVLLSTPEIVDVTETQNEIKLCTEDFLSQEPLAVEEKEYYDECKEYYYRVGEPLISVSEEILHTEKEIKTTFLKLCIDEECHIFDLQTFLAEFCSKINLSMADVSIKRIQIGSAVLEAEILNEYESHDKKLTLKAMCESITEKIREDFGKMKIFFMFLGPIKSLLNRQRSRTEIRLNPTYNRIYSSSKNFWIGPLMDGLDRGNMPYFCPVGWKRCSFYVTDRFYEKFKGWCICYHGTKFKNGLSILLNGLKPATKAEHGDGIYVSPSINYVAHPRYAEVKRIKSSDRSKFFKHGKYVQFVLECRVHPTNIKRVDRETLYAKYATIDPNVDNQVIEWVINNQNKNIVDFNDPDASIICTGIMMRITDEHPGLLPQSQWWYKSHLCNGKGCCLIGITLDSLVHKRNKGTICNIVYE